MRIRSQTSVIIDFDDASEEWRKNKISKINGTYVYKCNAPLRNGCLCQLPVVPTKTGCKRHSTIMQKSI